MPFTSQTMLGKAGADPVSKVCEAISVLFGSQVSTALLL